MADSSYATADAVKDSAAETKAPAAVEETKAPAFPVFGSGSTFGTGTGFAGFPAASAAAKTEDADATAAEGEEEAAPEEECQAEFKPIVQLEEVETTTGEEDETPLCELKSKLYRFDTETNEWKERGIGLVKLLQHKESKKVRLLMRQEKTLKIRANHFVMPGTKLQEHSGSDKAWVWSTVDFADEQQKSELFCMRFGSVEKAQEFKKKFEEVMEINAKLLGVPATAEEGDEAAEEKEDEADKLADEVKETVKVE